MVGFQPVSLDLNPLVSLYIMKPSGGPIDTLVRADCQGSQCVIVGKLNDVYMERRKDLDLYRPIRNVFCT